MTNIFAFTGIAYVYFLQPMLSTSKHYKTISFISIGISSIYLLLAVSCLLFSYANILSLNEISPIYFLVRGADFGKFIQRPDAIFFLGWILSLISYASVTVLFISRIFKKIGNLSARFPTCYIACTLIFIASMLPKRMVEIRFIENVFYKYSTIILVFIVSFLILLFANLKHIKMNTMQNKESDLQNE